MVTYAVDIVVDSSSQCSRPVLNLESLAGVVAGRRETAVVLKPHYSYFSPERVNSQQHEPYRRG